MGDNTQDPWKLFGNALEQVGKRLGRGAGYINEGLQKFSNSTAEEASEPKTFVLTKKKAIKFAESLKEKYPNVVSTKICRIENDKTGEVRIVQCMCDAEGKAIFADKEQKLVVARAWYKNEIQLSEQILELLGDEVECTIPLSDDLLTFSDVYNFAVKCKEKYPRIEKTELIEITNDKKNITHLVQMMVDSKGQYVYADENKEEMVSRELPVGIKLDKTLQELMSGDIKKCVIQL